METQEICTEFYLKHYFIFENTHVEGQKGKGAIIKINLMQVGFEDWMVIEMAEHCVQ
jgi:hypothetical protein